jgi:hypothetical protein
MHFTYTKLIESKLNQTFSIKDAKLYLNVTKSQ